MNEGIQGTAREMGGRMQEKAGQYLGDSKTQAQQTMGQVRDRVKDQPLTAMIVALGIGYIIGRLTA